MSVSEEYLKIAFNLPLNTLFTYAVPADLQPRIKVGKRVLAPFGSRRLTGYIVDISATSEVAGIKEIIAVLDEDSLINPRLLKLTRWMAEYYLCSWGACLAATLPKGIDVQSRQLISLTAAAKEKLADGDKLSTGIKGELLTLLQQTDSLPLTQLKKKLPDKGLVSAISGLQKQGLLHIENRLSSPRVKPLTQQAWQLAEAAATIEQEINNIRRRAPKQAAILLSLLAAGGELNSQQLKAGGLSRSSIASLINKGLISQIERPVLRQAYSTEAPPSYAPPLLPAQQAVADSIYNGLKAGRFTPILLHGITGSGKTEVYLNAIAKTLKLGRQALVLAPEISLTAQLWQRFYARFGSQVAVLHSQLSAGERLDEWYRLKRGEAKIAIGTRSAVFAPLDNVGLIVMDEEHDNSYKQENSPRYHAREVALKRGQLEQAVVILGSATPSLESFYRTKTKKHQLACLPQRIENRPLPEVEIVDMRGQARDESLSPKLLQAIKRRLALRQQSLLFLNRRGYTPFILCRKCGQKVDCPKCSVSLTYHLNGRARCHYCGYSIAPPRICSCCKGGELQYFGLGTQRLESRLKAWFPEARITRMDRDSTSRKGAHWQILRQLQARQIDILIGTQMVTKGFDLPGITLVGVIAADIGLGMPDFRAAERTFQLLTQVAGRAGRGDTPGEVIVQTYNPEHYSIQAARQHDYHKFYEQEITYRQSLRYPPITSMVSLLFLGRQAQSVAKAARRLADKLKQRYKGIQLLGPSPAVITRIKGMYRWQLMLKGVKLQDLHTALKNAINDLQYHPEFKGVKVEVDVDPVSLL